MPRVSRCDALCALVRGWAKSRPAKDFKADLGRRWRDKRGPTEAQRKRVRRGESEQRNERVFAPLGGNEGCGACDDEAQGGLEEEQEKLPGSCAPRQSHNCPQCGQFRGWTRAFQKQDFSH